MIILPRPGETFGDIKKRFRGGGLFPGKQDDDVVILPSESEKEKEARAFCPNGEGNGIDNSCGAKTMSAPDKDSGGGSSPSATPGDTWGDNTWATKSTPKELEHLGSIRVMGSRKESDIAALASSMGISGPSDLLTIGACNLPDAKVQIDGIGTNILLLRTDVPAGDGKIKIDTALTRSESGSTINYGYLALDEKAQKQALADPSIQTKYAGRIIAAMAASMEAAEKAGFVEADTHADGYGPGNTNGKRTDLQGYRLWGRFGFDGEISRGWFAKVKGKGVDVPSALSPEDKSGLEAKGSIGLQQLLKTKQGENIWKKWGVPIALTFNFKDKQSTGYQRYQKMLSLAKRAKQDRALFFEYVAGLEMREDPALWGGFVETRVFCATGVGGGVKNDCGPAQSAKSFPEGSQNLRDAVDSVAPAPEQVWDRSRGLAETPAPKEMDDIANEQTSHSGAALTPEAEASYGSLIDEIGRQYEALTDAGLKARAWRGDGEPYGDPPGSTKPNSDHMRKEIAKTGEYSFYMTDKGFGTGDATPNHPMLRETKFKTADGEPMIANDLFRVVHDMVAHVRGGYSFSTNGEYNGMLTHASTLPEEAWPALFAETFGQNAVYEKTKNYAPQNAYASKVGPAIIRSELKKRNKSSRAAKDDGDEPLGYQHIKSRPALLKSLVEQRAFCANGKGNGIDNSCGAKTMSAPDKDGGGGSSTASSVVFSSSTTAKLRDGDTIDASDEDADENVATINWQAAEDIGRSNPELQQAVYKYSADPHEVNGYFRYGESLDEYAENIGSTPEKLAASASATESAITTIAAAANPDGRELTSFRGLMKRRQNREYIEAIKSVSVGDVIKEAGVFSTSASLRRASMAFTSKDEGVIFRVKGKGGAPIAHVANYKDEWEVAYPNRSKFVVTSVARNVSVRISDSHRLTNVTFIDIREAD